MSVRCYVALGDSFSCGTDRGRTAPWPDLVAAALGPGVRYANLAAVGATSRDVELDQLGAALALEPDLVSLVCGANDVLGSVRPDPGAYSARLARIFARIEAQAPGARIVTATYPDLSRFIALRPRTRARVAAGVERFNEACRWAAVLAEVPCIDWSRHTGAGDRTNYASDGFHPSPTGHRQAAEDFLAVITGDRVEAA